MPVTLAMHDRPPSAAQRRLIALCRALGFGTITLDLLRGEPVWNPAPAAEQEIKYGAAHARAAQALSDPRPEDLQLVADLHRIGNATRLRLEVRHGTPFRLIRAFRALPI